MAQPSTESIAAHLLRPDIQEPVRAFADWLIQELGGNLVSLTVVGSVLTEDFHAARSDINTVLLVDKVHHTFLKSLARQGSKFGKRGFRAPWVMSGDYLSRSVDVFGVEFLDFQFNHATILGPDPFTNLTFNKGCIRLQCERDLRSAQIQLWQGYIRTLGNYKEIYPLLTLCTKQLLPLIRAMLWIVGQDRPRTVRAVLEAVGNVFHLEESQTAALLTVRFQDEAFGPDGTDLLFQQVYHVVEHLVETIDKIKTDL